MIHFFRSGFMKVPVVNLKFFLFILASVIASNAIGQLPGGDSMVNVYNQQALKYLNESKYDESIESANNALKIKDNSVSRYYLTHVYSLEKNWPEAIANGEQAIKLDPTQGGPYPDLFYAYIQAGKWSQAKSISDKVKQANPNQKIDEDLANIESSIDNENRSHLLMLILFSVLVGVFFRPIFLLSRGGGQEYFTSAKNTRISELILISASVSGILWITFFAFSHWIWAQNPHYSASEFTPIVRIFIYEHDGAESFVLFSMMLVNLAATILFTPIILKTRTNKNLYLGIFTVLVLLSGYYFFSIGFYPPLPGMDGKNIIVPIVLVALSAGLYFVYQKNSVIAKIIAICFMAFAGLIAIGPPSLTDLQFIIDPALRLMHGFKVSEIYFQYDLLLSFLAVAWMKLNFSIELFPYLGQVSFFLFYLAVFFFSDGFFKSKGLSVLLIIALVIMRFYSIFSDVPTIIQVTPLRLDMWIILLLVAYKKGIHHWLLGASIGFLVLFHRNLGLLYLAAYAELLVVMYLAEAATLIREKKWSMSELVALMVKHVKMNLVNLLIIIGSIGLCFLMFHEFFSKSAMLYRKLGIGMLPISKISFYWYVPVLLGTLISVVYFNRNKLDERYTSTTYFIIMLVISNSMYFFGRSHENNILNISAILVLALFVLFDVLIYLSPKSVGLKQAASPVAKPAPAVKNKKVQSPQPVQAPQPSGAALAGINTYLALPLVFILLIGYFYNQRISDKLKTQYANLLESNFSYPFPEYPKDMETVKVLTHNSQNVYFLDLYYDAFYYYNGNYSPLGFFSPASSWVFKKDVVNFMQDLLDKHYYVVYVGQFEPYYREYLPYLKYNQVHKIHDWVALEKDDVNLLLPETLPSQYHVGIKDTLGALGIEYQGINLKESFTLEAIVKPVGAQVNNACIINNLTRVNGFKGFTLQANGTMPGKYVFGFSNGLPNMPNVVFDLESDKWHYLVVTVNREALKVYDNGKLVGTAPCGGAAIINAENPFIIGNQPNHDAKFNGLIREINISNGNLDEGTIIQNAGKIDKL